jgi:hypothetical protein
MRLPGWVKTVPYGDPSTDSAPEHLFDETAKLEAL